MSRFLIVLPGLVLLIVLPFSGFAVSIDVNAHRKSDVVQRGAEVYAAQCAACHGIRLEGQEDWQVRDPDGYLPAPPHDATGHTWHHPTRQLFEITKYGTEQVVGGGYRSNMIGFEDVLSDDDILAVLAFIKSTWPRQIVDHHDRIDAAHGSQ